jgi:light-regulated signal transduction histidine kinase (bacteriophytochrome)
VEQRTAELQRSNQNLEAFTYSVSHDLRSPLRALSGFSQALVEEYGDRLDDTGRGYAGRIQAASERMGTLIDDLLRVLTSRAMTRPSAREAPTSSHRIPPPVGAARADHSGRGP